MNQYRAQIKIISTENDLGLNLGQINIVTMNITNIGSEVWYAYDKDNPVVIAYKYSDEQGKLKEGMRTKLPFNVLPGESVLIKANYFLETKPLNSEIIWDLVHEGISWFENYGSQTTSTKLSENSSVIQHDLKEDSVVVCKSISKKFKNYPSNWAKFLELLSLGTIKKHQDYWALKNISFEVGRGETYGIIGFNGSGKSTLLSILAQTRQPTDGNFIVKGRIAALLELGAGFHPELTGRENVLYNSYLYGIPSNKINEKMDSIIDFSGIGKFIDQPVKNYSSGMYVRLAFSLAIHVDPDILIIDEALAVGDEVFQRKCYSKFEEFKAMGKTIILVSHDLNAIRSLCDRASIIYNGNLIFEGSSNDVVNYYQKMTLTANLKVNMNQEVTSHDDMRYGNGKARILEYKFLDNDKNEALAFKTGEKMYIQVSIEVLDTISTPVLGVIYKTINGVEVFGTNTKILGCNFGSVAKGDIIYFEISIPLYLNEGTYFLSLGVSDQSGGETVTVDRLIDVSFIRVISDIPCIGLANFNIGAGAAAYVK